MGDINSEMLSKELLIAVAEIASNTAIEFYRDEMKRAEKRKYSERIKNTKTQLRAYRKIKAKLNDEKCFTDEEKAEYRWKFVEDLMGSSKEIVSKSERIIKDEEKKRQEDLYAIYRIETAMRLFKEECEMSSSEEVKRRYREVYGMYIAEKPLSAQELAEQECVSEKTVYRDVGIACQVLAIYLYGI